MGHDLRQRLSETAAYTCCTDYSSSIDKLRRDRTKFQKFVTCFMYSSLIRPVSWGHSAIISMNTGLQSMDDYRQGVCGREGSAGLTNFAVGTLITASFWNVKRVHRFLKQAGRLRVSRTTKGRKLKSLLLIRHFQRRTAGLMTPHRSSDSPQYTQCCC